MQLPFLCLFVSCALCCLLLELRCEMLVPTHASREAINNTVWRREYIHQSLGEAVQPLTMGAAPLLLSPSPVPLRPARQVQEAMADLPQNCLIPQFPFSPYPPWVSGHVLVLLTAPVDNLRSREEAKQAREDSIPCQPTAQTGRQSPAPAGAKHGLI